MPYQNQTASKSGHIDIVRNADVNSFLDQCNYIKEPTEKEAQEIVTDYTYAPLEDRLPEKVIASDGSPYVEPINGKFPSTQIAYIKMSLVLVDVNHYGDLMTPGERFVDPFKVATLYKNADAITFTLPGSNVKYKSEATVKNGFRLALYEQLSDIRTAMTRESYTVLDTLFALQGQQYNSLLRVGKCPNCEYEGDNGGNRKGFWFECSSPVQKCPRCKVNIYATDCLRLHEEISDFGSNISPMTRFMNVIEHLVIAGMIRMLHDREPAALSKLAFIMDGPLAVFGQPAWVGRWLMPFLFKVDQSLIAKGLNPLLIVGLQKTGMLMEHAQAVQRFVKPGHIRIVDDDYRYKYVNAGADESKNFGEETYYGQDFLFKTEKGQMFSFAIPYPFESKGGTDFKSKKAEISRYRDKVARACSLIRHFEFDLYHSAVVPVALAHRHASISLMPGGKVLDLLSRTKLGG
ncbi:MAG: hypothetical protein WCA07_00170 [Gloeobacterales cyanobacterium]